MKKTIIMLLGLSLLLGSCGSYRETNGAYVGGMFGDVLGSAIGGIAGGWRGQHVGSLIGTVGGAIAGAAIASAADRQEESYYNNRPGSRHISPVTRQDSRRGNTDTRGTGNDDGVYDPQMLGDDRIVFDGDGGDDRIPSDVEPINIRRSSYARTDGSALVIRNAGVYEMERDGVLSRGETCDVVFEILNDSDSPVLDVFPLVEEVTGNKHIHISPNLRVESIAPHRAVRYTAKLFADKGLRNGQIVVKVGVAQGKKVVEGQTRLITVDTIK